LKEITLLETSSLETAESLEQNRWLENGLKIRTAVTDQESISIDTPEDLVRAKELLKNFE
jgi:3-deoxy-manno-octulosonate cytidylyltransferase (CMP-KDO synthetase)